MTKANRKKFIVENWGHILNLNLYLQPDILDQIKRSMVKAGLYSSATRSNIQDSAVLNMVDEIKKEKLNVTGNSSYVQATEMQDVQSTTAV